MPKDDDENLVETEDEFETDDEPTEVDEEELDEADLAVDEDDDDFETDDESFEEDEDDDDEASAKDGPVRKSVKTDDDDDDDDDDIIAPDDVEADLDTILKDRMVTVEDDANDDDEDEPEEKGDPGDRLQPKRADEQLCSTCFLLVRQSAPGCPIGDDDCPLFS